MNQTINVRDVIIHSFINRKHAGNLLSQKLLGYKHSNAIIIAISFGGTVVAQPIALKLGLPLDILFSKKITHPDNHEFAIASVTQHSVIINDHKDIPKKYYDRKINKYRKQLIQKLKDYNPFRPQINKPEGKIVIIIDDGIRTDSSILAVIQHLRKQQVHKIIAAVPLIQENKIRQITNETDEFLYLKSINPSLQTCTFYDDHKSINEQMMMQILKKTNHKFITIKN